MDLKELESGVNPDIHWYYQSKKLQLISYTKKLLEKNNELTIVDVGSGSGFFALLLEKEFSTKIKKVYLVDIGYTEEEINETKNKKIEKTLAIPQKIENGLVILMDVLEHLEDDYKMLKEIKAACTVNNHFYITVPAFMSLWSGHDVYLEHYRRYKIKTLTEVLKRADFKVANSFYLYGILFPFAFVIRKMDNAMKKEAKSYMKPLSSFANKVLFKVNELEMNIASANKYFGISCVALGEI